MKNKYQVFIKHPNTRKVEYSCMVFANDREEAKSIALSQLVETARKAPSYNIVVFDLTELRKSRREIWGD